MDTGGPELIETPTKPAVRYRGRRLYSGTDPEYSALKRLEGVRLQSKTLVVVPSPVLFYGFSRLMELLPPRCHVLCIETDQELMAFSTARMPGPLRVSGLITFVRTDSAEQVHRVVTDLGPWNFRRAVLLPLSGGYALHSGKYRELFSVIESCIRSSWQNKMTSIHMVSLWFRNLFSNLSSCTGAVLDVPELAGEKPVLVTGAGISLESSIPLIKKYRNSFFLLTVDTALPVLELHGILPDGICILEGQMYNHYDFLGTAARGAAVFADSTAYPPSLRFFTGPLYLFFSEFAPTVLLERMRRHTVLPRVFPPLGSIGVTALNIARHITSGPVIFTGVDFAYRIGKTHANGAPSHTALLCGASRTVPPLSYGICIGRPRFQAEAKRNNPEKTVTTDLVLHSYLGPLNSVIADGGRCFDIADFGVRNKAQLLPDTAAFEDLLRPHGTGTGRGKDRGRGGNTLQSAAVKNFLHCELRFLDETIEAGTRFITTDQSVGSTKTTMELLSRTDYVYLHFPDPPPLPKEDPGFVKRAVISARNYRELLSNCLDFLVS